MNKHIEKEYKVLLSEDQFKKLCALYKNLNFVTQVNTYYDTQNHTVQNKKGAMRIREKNGTYIFTLKMHQDGLDGLCECECMVSENSVNAFQQADIRKLLEEYNIYGAIVSLTTLTTKRAVIDLKDAELCFDISTYSGYTDYEIEYEYKREHDGLSVFQEILNHIHVTYISNCQSKIQRALHAIEK